MTGAGAGEDQTQKVVAGEASRCGEDKYAWFKGLVGQRGLVRAAWWQEQQDEVVDRSLCRVAAHGRSLHEGLLG
jgi:hypothetical protein